MDWIERLLHVSPDGGSGWFEFQLLLLPVVTSLIVVELRRRIGKRRLKTNSAGFQKG